MSAPEAIDPPARAPLRRRLPAILLALALGTLLCEGLLWGLSFFLRVDGPRGEALDLAAHPGLRVLCLGDSNTFGWSEPADGSYPAQLEVLLDERVEGGPHKVINLGMPGVNSRQVVELLPRELERYEPDLVLVKIGFNNRWSWTQGSSLEVLGPPWYEGLRLVRLARLASRSLALDRREQAQQRFLPGDFLTELDTEREAGQVIGLDREGREVRYDAQGREQELEDVRMQDSIEGDLDQLAGLCAERDTPLVLLTYCREEHDYALANRAIRAAAAANRLPLADPGAAIASELLPRFGFDQLFFSDDHPRRLGYGACARLVYEALVGAGLVVGQARAEPLADLVAEQRPPAPMRMLGRVDGEPGSEDELSVEIYDEEPARRFALFLCSADSEGERPIVQGHSLPLIDDAIFQSIGARESTYGVFDARGRARVRLGQLIRPERAESLRGRELVAVYLTFWGKHWNQVRWVSDPARLVIP